MPRVSQAHLDARRAQIVDAARRLFARQGFAATSMQDIFRFEQDGFTPEGKVRGRFVPTGHVPDFIQDLVKRGIEVDMSIYSREAPAMHPSVKRVF